MQVANYFGALHLFSSGIILVYKYFAALLLYTTKYCLYLIEFLAFPPY